MASFHNPKSSINPCRQVISYRNHPCLDRTRCWSPMYGLRQSSDRVFSQATASGLPVTLFYHSLGGILHIHIRARVKSGCHLLEGYCEACMSLPAVGYRRSECDISYAVTVTKISYGHEVVNRDNHSLFEYVFRCLAWILVSKFLQQR